MKVWVASVPWDVRLDSMFRLDELGHAPLVAVGSSLGHNVGALALCDAILMPRGWQNHLKATRERQIAGLVGVPVFYSIDDLAKEAAPPTAPQPRA